MKFIFGDQRESIKLNSAGKYTCPYSGLYFLSLNIFSQCIVDLSIPHKDMSRTSSFQAQIAKNNAQAHPPKFIFEVIILDQNTKRPDLTY